MGTINKTELARAVAEETGLSNGQAKEAIEATLERIAGEVSELLAGYPMPGWTPTGGDE